MPDQEDAVTDTVPTWWAVEVTGPESSSVELCQDLDGLLATISTAAAGMAEARIVAVDPRTLALLRLRSSPPVRGSGVGAASPARQEPPSAVEGWPVTAEQACQWPVTEWTAFLHRALITPRQACARMSELVGQTVGLADIKGHPDRAAALLAMASESGRRAS